MTDLAANSAVKFKKSFPVLARFLDRWVDKIKNQCLNEDLFEVEKSIRMGARRRAERGAT